MGWKKFANSNANNRNSQNKDLSSKNPLRGRFKNAMSTKKNTHKKTISSKFNCEFDKDMLLSDVVLIKNDKRF